MIVVFGAIALDFGLGLHELPDVTETAVVRDGEIEPGGNGANQAVAAAREGARVVMVGTVGNDPLAEPALSGLVAAGVDVSRVRRAHVHTGFAAILRDRRGGRRVLSAMNANRFAAAAQVEDALLTPDTVLLTQTGPDPSEIDVLITRASRRGARIILNLSPPAVLAPEAMRAIDYLVVTDREVGWLAHRVATGNNAASLHAALGAGVICAQQTGGLEAVTRAGHWQIPAHAVGVVDNSSVPDAIAGVFAAAIDRGMAMEPALRRANAAAAIASTRDGTQGSLPHAAEIDTMVREARHTELL